YLRLADAASAMPADALACLRFGTDGADIENLHRVPLTAIGEPALEVWPAAGPVRRFDSQGFACAEDGEHLFFWRIDSAASDVEKAAESAYRDLLALCAGSGYPELLRIWNYFDEVTVGEGDNERYRRFCVGRHRVLAAPGFERRLPAATLIGTHVPGLQLYGFASRTAGRQIENPRQTSAFRYPREYGPSSPSFSRATRYGDTLLVSGTAAIVGHQTQHPNAVLPQARAMLDNVQALLGNAGAERWQPQILRLYLRDPADAAAVVDLVKTRFGADAPLLVVEGEVCRRDLLVEIEGVFAQSQHQ
ncbi:MAG: Chorismate lyase / 3-hydroxybenzoate synthase, partial [Hydrocarboniphaga sp.]|uniref:chorismate transformation enzyme, FkbO/Hyg5 family n=1 Tax=Hydrocarboniphaga sp. TaxID=2033016 RepID=UPI00280EEA76|nr:Chorismate lyase / 3-hydroxybenzoate synthase [Hydrocarboniphaga sp.]